MAFQLKCGMFLLMLLFTFSVSSCVEEATLENTNYESITVETPSASSITANSVIITAACSAPQNRSSFSYGICIGTSQNPTIETDYIYWYKVGKLDSFSLTCDNLQPLTTYYARAYAVDASRDPVYGNQISFRTTSTYGYPVITTTAISSITSSTAVSGGYVSSSGSYTVTARGVCWGEDPYPTIAYNTDFTTNSYGSGSFTSTLTNLTEGTTYYVRAYATNSLGTSYGNEISFTATGTTATVTDYDGNIYHTVNIGTQVWMVENLKTTHYNDGTSIPLVTDTTSWKAKTTPAYCWYVNDATTYKFTFGALYNWYTVNTGKLAPIGWHVPTDAEWTTLTDYLGTTAAKSLAATTLWNTSAITGAVGNDLSKNNSSGFTAFPCGYRYLNPTLFYNGGYSTIMWSSTQYNTTSAWFLGLYSDELAVYRDYYLKQLGCSVRCIKN